LQNIFAEHVCRTCLQNIVAEHIFLTDTSRTVFMARWIAFDQQTSSLLRSMLAQGTRIETLLRGPVDYALARPSAVVTVLPASGGAAGIAVFRPSRHVAVTLPQSAVRQCALPPRASQRSEGTRAGGFLGLSDEAVFEEDRPKPKQGWWRKFWEE
jgi:hypothetical protein